jgi:hypothetical protein
VIAKKPYSRPAQGGNKMPPKGRQKERKMKTTVKELEININAVSVKQKEYAESLTDGFLVQFARLITDAQGKSSYIGEAWLNDAWNAKIEWLKKKWNEKIDLIRGMDAAEIIDKMNAGAYQYKIPFSIFKIEKRANEIFDAKKKEIVAASQAEVTWNGRK